jgi:O-methyltransferase involved in polyketide biosynthesis
MTENNLKSIQGVAETMLITLYTRALESQREDGLIRDQKAVEIVKRLDYDWERLRLHGHDEVAVILREKEFDRFAREFMTKYPDGMVVHIGCGLDTRFNRVDNDQVEWYDLDLADVIRLRKDLIGEDNPRCRLIGCSVFDFAWMGMIPNRQHPVLFMAEGVFPYFEEIQLRALFLELHRRFPGCEVVCDAHTPYVIWMDNLHLAFSKVKARLHWKLKHGRDVETWGDGFRLLEEWFYFDHPEPRLGAALWMKNIPWLARSTGIFHYQLGSRPLD